MIDHLEGTDATIKRLTGRTESEKVADPWRSRTKGQGPVGSSVARWIGRVSAPWGDADYQIAQIGRNREQCRRRLNRAFAEAI